MRLARAGVPLIVVALWSGSARAQDTALQESVAKVLQLNKAALDDVDLLEWESAKKRLLDALVLAKQSGLDTHPIMARTYVHLGGLYVMGFKNREKAMQCFRRAFAIQPDIRLSRGTASIAEVHDVFEEAAGRTRPERRPTGRGDAFAEPDLPARVSALDCPVAEQTWVDQAVPVRCAVAPGLPVTKVFLLYREPVKRRFTEVEMKKTPKGWFEGRIPERVIYGQSVRFYLEARDAGGKPIVRNGDAQYPNLIVIVQR